MYLVGRDENIPIERVTDRLRDVSVVAQRIPRHVHFYFIGDIENAAHPVRRFFCSKLLSVTCHCACQRDYSIFDDDTNCGLTYA